MWIPSFLKRKEKVNLDYEKAYFAYLASRPKLTTLEKNLKRLSNELEQHSRKKKIAILGQPGAGKSSIIDILTNYQSDPRPKIGQQTDATDWSKDPQVHLLHLYRDHVFVDVPGYNTTSHPVESFLQYFPFQLFDSILFVIKGKLYGADQRIWEYISGSAVKNLIVRTFTDGLSDEEKNELVTDINHHFGREFVAVSNRYKTGFSDIWYFLNQ